MGASTHHLTCFCGSFLQEATDSLDSTFVFHPEGTVQCDTVFINAVLNLHLSCHECQTLGVSSAVQENVIPIIIPIISLMICCIM